MPSRLPKQADFAHNKSLSVSVVPPSSPQKPINVLILLHGLGDSETPFTNLGRQLNLPETACISVRGPRPMPFDLGGFHWSDDLDFDPNTGTMEKDAGFKASAKLIIQDVIKEGLIGKCGYSYRDIVLFGYSQGGMTALQVAVELQDQELGGVVSVAGWLPNSAPMLPIDVKSKTSVLLCKAATGSDVPPSAVNRMKDTFRDAEVKEWKRKGDGMPSNRDEMYPIMQFFARRLRSMRGVPEGAIELS